MPERDEWPCYGAPMPYAKDRSFSIGWMTGGIFLMFVTNIIGGLLAGVAGIQSVYGLAGVGAGCFALGGFIVGWKSEGRTIIEAGLAAAIATLISLEARRLYAPKTIKGLPITALLIGLSIPFVAGIVGAFFGELIQGDTVGD
jgi:hypothetical protein